MAVSFCCCYLSIGYPAPRTPHRFGPPCPLRVGVRGAKTWCARELPPRGRITWMWRKTSPSRSRAGIPGVAGRLGVPAKTIKFWKRAVLFSRVSAEKNGCFFAFWAGARFLRFFAHLRRARHMDFFSRVSANGFFVFFSRVRKKIGVFFGVFFWFFWCFFGVFVLLGGCFCAFGFFSPR